MSNLTRVEYVSSFASNFPAAFILGCPFLFSIIPLSSKSSSSHFGGFAFKLAEN